MADTAYPVMSLILCASGGYPAVSHTVHCLARQTIAARLELVLLGFNGSLELPATIQASFAACQQIPLEKPVSVAVANSIGVRAARAPIVALCEDHCFPDHDWAESLLAAHQSPHAVIAPVFRNANPGTIVSWCDFLIGYGPWMDPSPAGVRPFLPGHNSSYKRAELLAYDERLASMLESETVLHYDLTAKGRTLFLEPSARVAHMNFSLLPVWLRVQYHAGRVFAGFRASKWSLAKKLLFTLASPLIPAVRLARICGQFRSSTYSPLLFWRVLPLLALGLAIDAAGQAMGYLLGPGMSAELLSTYEYNRIRYVTAADRTVLESDF